MKICLNTVTVGPDHRLEAIIDEMGRWGYAGIEIEAGRLASALGRASIDQVRGWLADQGIAAASLMAWPFKVDGDLTSLLDDIRRQGTWRDHSAPPRCSCSPARAARKILPHDPT